MDLKSIAKIVKNGKNIAIFGHISPDMDCFGSAFSLQVILQRMGKLADVFIDGEISEKDNKVFEGCKICSKDFLEEDYDLVVIVDTPNDKRLGKYGNVVQKHKNIVKIDHHHEKERFFSEQEYVDVKSTSCSEICYLLIKELKQEISSDIATFVYAGISSDSNSFLNDNTTTRSLKIASELSEKGANISLVNEILFKSNTIEDWKLDKIVYDTTEIYKNFGFVIIRYKDLKKLGYNKAGTSRYATKIVNMEGIQIGCSVTERNLNTYDCSFRSKKAVDVNVLAKKFGGGGHINASGCVITGKYKDVREKIIKAIKETLSEQGY